MDKTIALRTPIKNFWMRFGLVASKPGETKWDILAGIVVIHAIALLAPFTFTWSAFWAFVIMVPITGMVGITLCYHRLVTHRSFMVPKWFEYILVACGILAMQGGPLKWVSTHRVHHAFSDRPQDPHSPNKGFWWAHMLWLFPYDETLDDSRKFLRFVPELAKDSVYIWLERYQALIILMHGLILFALGGLPMLVWGFFLRAVFVYHSTWLVNSASHLWGYQTFATNEGSRNNWWVAVLTFGEGWHNNHHAYPNSAAHGLRWWEFDATFLTIRLLSWMKLARRIRLPQGGPAKLPKFEGFPSRKIRLTMPLPSLPMLSS